MSDPAMRRPIGAHPAFPAAIVLWLAALFGLAVLVLPGWALARLLGGVGLTPPLDQTAHLAISLTAAGLGGLLGLVVALPLARRARRRAGHEEDDYEPAPMANEPAESGAPLPRLLRIREELEADFAAEHAAATDDGAVPGAEEPVPDRQSPPGSSERSALAALERLPLGVLVERFDRALARLAPRAAARTPAHRTVIDHQAGLRAALDKLADTRQDI